MKNVWQLLSSENALEVERSKLPLTGNPSREQSIFTHIHVYI